MKIDETDFDYRRKQLYRYLRGKMAEPSRIFRDVPGGYGGYAGRRMEEKGFLRI